MTDIGAEEDGIVEFDPGRAAMAAGEWAPVDDEYVVFEEATFRAAAHLMVTRSDLFAGCSTSSEVFARIQELDDSGALEALKTKYRATP